MKQKIIYQQKGLSLVELMVTVAVLGILLTIGIPEFRGMLHSHRSAVLANELIVALNLARSEAVRRGAAIDVCASAAGVACDSNDWEQGWIVQVRGGGPAGVLRVWQAPGANAIIATAAPVVNTISFGPLGNVEAGVTSFTVRFQGCQGPRARQVDVNRSGLVSARRVNCP